MIIECDSCEVRGHACGDCVIGVLLGAPGEREPGNEEAGVPSGAPIVQLDAREQRAIAVLAEQGLVPRLRLVATAARRATPPVTRGGAARDTG
ncbi:MAG TPA: hypothetical protein VER39_08740 [Nocardioidaceae bacterium]|nr:hypothetical protein [Nocardioidaceae bacterium]